MSQTDDLTKWVAKEINQLSGSTLRLALLAIIKKYKSAGIYGYAIGEELFSFTEGELNSASYSIFEYISSERM